MPWTQMCGWTALSADVLISGYVPIAKHSFTGRRPTRASRGRPSIPPLSAFSMPWAPSSCGDWRPCSSGRLKPATPIEILSHRVIWSLLLMIVLVAVLRDLRDVPRALSSLRKVGLYA